MNALAPASPHAQRIADLFWVQVAVSTAVYALVMAALIWAVARKKRPAPGDPASEKRLKTGVLAATIATAATLFALLFASVTTGRALGELGDAEDARVIKIVGHQWWWEVIYPDPDPSKQVTTANELHLPAGRAARLELASADVIHSLWIPELHGKRDLIPSFPATLVLRAEKPGVYHGQCAEFCGYQHANMRIHVVVESEDQLEAWLEAARKPAEEPAAAAAKRGKDVFLGGPCPMCHSIAGTPAAATRAPDLTHVASRITIAAGARPNTRAHLGAWVLDPQSVKPGNYMPATAISSEDLEALVAYLESLR